MTCVRHAAPITVHRDPDGFALTAGAFETPEPLGSPVLSLDPSKRDRVLTGLPGFKPTRIKLTWADMTVPHYTRDDWEWLAGRLRKLPRLHVHCRAGHGRTGTALAILATLWDMVPRDTDPVAWIRERYCPNAVETAAQIAYVARITGRTVTAAPSLGAGSSLMPTLSPTREVWAPTPAPRADVGASQWSPREGWTPPAGSTLRHDAPGQPSAWTGQRNPGRSARLAQRLESHDVED